MTREESGSFDRSPDETDLFPTNGASSKEEVLTERLFKDEPRRVKKREREGLTIDVRATDYEDAVLVEPGPAIAPRPIEPAIPAQGQSSRKKTATSQRPKSVKVKGPAAPYVLLELAGGRIRCWQLTAEGIRAADAIPDRATAISISAADQRLIVKSTLSDHRAQTLLGEAAFETVYAINRSRTMQTVYGTSQLRIDSAPYFLSSGILALDVLCQEREAAAPVFGWLLKDVEGKDAILALYHRSASGFVSGPVLSVYPQDVQSLISQFKAAQQVREPAQVALFGAPELIQAAANLQRYPQKPLLGLTSRHLIWLLVLFGTVCFATLSFDLASRSEQALLVQRASIARTEARLLGKAPSRPPVRSPVAGASHFPD